MFDTSSTPDVPSIPHVPDPFGRTLRSLEAEGFRGRLLTLLLPTALLSLWAGWLFLARVSVFAQSDSARLEADRAVHPVQAAVGGRVAASFMVLGAEVAAGDLLVQLDSTVERLQLREEEARRDALVKQVASIQAEAAAKEGATGATSAALRLALQEAEQRLQEGEARARLSAEEAARSERLRQNGLVSELDLLRTRTESQKSAANAETLRLTVDRLQFEQQVRHGALQGELAALRGRLAEAEGQLSARNEAVARLVETISKRAVRAPASGRLAEIAEIDNGGFVSEGAQIATIVPEGPVRVVAFFQPYVALGRVRSGQPARLRLHGFPWTQYGSVAARVERVAGEPHDGRIRVELAAEPGSRVNLEHGLPGDVEVEIERVSPATLLLRSAGRLARAAPRPPDPSKDQPRP